MEVLLGVACGIYLGYSALLYADWKARTALRVDLEKVKEDFTAVASLASKANVSMAEKLLSLEDRLTTIDFRVNSVKK